MQICVHLKRLRNTMIAHIYMVTLTHSHIRADHMYLVSQETRYTCIAASLARAHIYMNVHAKTVCHNSSRVNKCN